MPSNNARNQKKYYYVEESKVQNGIHLILFVDEEKGIRKVVATSYDMGFANEVVGLMNDKLVVNWG